MLLCGQASELKDGPHAEKIDELNDGLHADVGELNDVKKVLCVGRRMLLEEQQKRSLIEQKMVEYIE